MSKVAVVILNWNGEKFLKKYIPALVTNTPAGLGGEKVELVVADNGSTDGSIQYLKENYPQIGIIPFKENFGFTGGYNRALKQVEADYFILLNSDILVPCNWLEPMVDFMDSHPQVGVCQPKMLSEGVHQQLCIQETGGEDLSGRFTPKDSGKEMFEYAGACGGFIDILGFPLCRGVSVWICGMYSRRS